MAWNGVGRAGRTANGKANRPAGWAASMRAPSAHIAKPGARRPKRWLIALLALLVIVALGGAAVWFFAQPAPAPSPKPKAQSATNAPKPKKPYIAPVKRAVMKTGDKVKDALAEVKATGDLVAIAPPPIDPEAMKQPRGKRIFKTSTEQLLGWIVSVEPGDMPMPIPPIGAEERENLACILVGKNEINEGDSERVANLKQDVDYAKQEMAKYIEAGGDPDDFMRYYFKQLNFAFETRNEVMSQYEELREEDAELAEQFLDKANKMLAEKGIKRLPTAKEVAQAREQRELEKENAK